MHHQFRIARSIALLFAPNIPTRVLELSGYISLACVEILGQYLGVEEVLLHCLFESKAKDVPGWDLHSRQTIVRSNMINTTCRPQSLLTKNLRNWRSASGLQNLENGLLLPVSKYLGESEMSRRYVNVSLIFFLIVALSVEALAIFAFSDLVYRFLNAIW